MQSVDMGTVSPSSASSVKRGRNPWPRGADRPLLLHLGVEALLEFTGQFDESRGETDVFVHRIAMIVPGNDFRTSLIGYGGGDFVEAGAEQIGNDAFDLLARKQFAQGM